MKAMVMMVTMMKAMVMKLGDVDEGGDDEDGFAPSSLFSYIHHIHHNIYNIHQVHCFHDLLHGKTMPWPSCHVHLMEEFDQLAFSWWWFSLLKRDKN